MKKLLIILATIITCVLLIPAFIDKLLVHQDISAKVCKETILLKVTDPTSVKINKISKVTGDLKSFEVDDWVIKQNYSENVTKSLLDGKSFPKSMKTIYISIDYSSNENFIGVSRNEFLCGFVIDLFGNNVFETITYKNKDYEAKEVFLFKDRPSRYNTILLSTKLTYLDKLKFVLTFPFQ